MRKRYYAMPLGVVLAFGLAACSDDDDINPGVDNQEYNPGKIEMTSSQLATVAKCNDFGFKLLDVVSNSDEFAGKNVILSPISFNYAFSMLANGADGATREQIINALGYDDASIDEVNDINYQLTHKLGTLDSKVTLNFANSVWAQPNIAINGAYVSTLSKCYDAEVKSINNKTYVNDVNKWCSSKTNGKITDFLSPGTTPPAFALFNAVYFKGIWSSDCKFDAKNTATDNFHNAEGTVSNADFMKKTCGRYGKSASMQGCDLVFGNSSFRIMFILPDEGVTISQALDNLAAGEWEQLKAPYHPEGEYVGVDIALKLPKFKIESEINFMDMLADLGMNDLLGKNADYSNITASELVINLIKQKAMFEINEEGAEAAAVTGTGWYGADLSPRKLVAMTFDRPFIYVIHEHSTGAILFAGCVNTFAK